MTDSVSRWIPFGTITRAHGIRGELRLVPHARGDTLPDKIENVRIECPGKAPVEFQIESVRSARDAMLLRLASIDDRDRAEKLAGAELSLRESDLPPPQDGEFYLFELVGAGVSDENAIDLGTIAGFLNSRAGDILRIHTHAGERLLPLEGGVLRFDRKTNTVTVRVPKGLW